MLYSYGTANKLTFIVRRFLLKLLCSISRVTFHFKLLNLAMVYIGQSMISVYFSASAEMIKDFKKSRLHCQYFKYTSGYQEAQITLSYSS